MLLCALFKVIGTKYVQQTVGDRSFKKFYCVLWLSHSEHVKKHNLPKKLNVLHSPAKLELLTLLDAGGRGGADPPLALSDFVRDAPTNSKFLDFYQLHPYFHLIKSFFTFFCDFYKNITIKKNLKVICV